MGDIKRVERPTVLVHEAHSFVLFSPSRCARTNSQFKEVVGIMSAPSGTQIARTPHPDGGPASAGATPTGPPQSVPSQQNLNQIVREA